MMKFLYKLMAARRIFSMDKQYYPSDYLMDVLKAFQRRTSTPKHHIFVTCFPKSGSTFITKKLQAITGYEEGKYVFNYLRNEREMYMPRFVDHMSKNTVSQHHTRATEPNLRIWNQFDIRLIVLTRNIFDVVVSFRDHFMKEGPVNPYAYLTGDFYNLSEEAQFDHIVEMIVPWYFNFYVSWSEAERQNSIAFKWMSYESIMADKVKGMKEILDYYGIDISLDTIQEKIEAGEDNGKTRFNKGVSGRGLETLTEAQIEKIRSYAKFYPSIDFSKIGLS